ncbi:MAG: SDR family oxidoreductase [Cyclobacteriaceae bacterium]
MDKIVLITGTSTGIGKACALYMDQLGFTVYAGVRRSDDGTAMKKQASERLKIIIVDVTDEHAIANAVKQIQTEHGRLDALINNAGIGIGGPLELMDTKVIQGVFNVNVVGLLAVTKAFLPLLRSSKGRIINIGSSAGYLAFPGACAYCGSKFAVRAITDALRLEFKHFGIKVILVSPGAVESAIWDKGKAYKEDLRDKADMEIGQRYDTLRRFGDSLYTDLKKIPAIEAAKVVAEALTSAHPKRYYVVGKDAKGARKVSYLPAALLDWIILRGINKFSQHEEVINME